MLVGKDKFTSVYYSGTFFVQKNDDNDYAGFVFNYQSNKRYTFISINLLLIMYNIVLFKVYCCHVEEREPNILEDVSI